MLKEQAKEMLETSLLPFWMGLRDEKYGGFYGYMDQDLHVDRKAEKGCILNSRILWFFSQSAWVLGRGECLDCADHAYRFLRDRCLDRKNGGVFWSLTYDGAVLDDTKHTYNQAFAIYALSAYYGASGDPEALELAMELFRVIETRCRDGGGYLEAFDREFRPVSNEKLSENGVLAQRTMNTLLHVFEGCAGLYEVSRAPEVRAAMEEILSIYQKRIYNPKLRRQEVFFDLDYHSLIDLHSYGHDIESSWLLDWGCSLLGDRKLKEQVGAIDSALAENVYECAFRDGSLVNECERGAVDGTRVWWVQAEGVLGFLNQWRKHPEQTRFRTGAEDIFRYIRDVLVDPRPGSEWFWSVDEKGVPTPGKPIVESWKCPYHNGRMCLEIIRGDF